MAKIYIRPKQSVAGQLFDVAFLLALVFGGSVPADLAEDRGALAGRKAAGRRHLSRVAADGTKALDRPDLGEARPKSDHAGAVGEARLHHGNRPPTSSPSPSTTPSTRSAWSITGVVIIGYFVFLMVMSDREYKQVIAEKFD